jgi:hypothetical protein
MLSNQDAGYIAILLQLSERAKVLDEHGALWTDLLEEAQETFDKAVSNIVEARVVSINKD